MPAIADQHLSVTMDGADHVRIKVTYRVTFNTFERNLPVPE